MANTNTQKIVQIRITDHNGHTTLEETIDQAVETVVSQHFSQGKWPYVGSRVFQFTAVDESDTEALFNDAIRLKDMLLESDEPIVTLAGDLQGGASEFDPSRTVTLRIADHTGHTTLEQSIEAAVATAVKEWVKNKKWTYIGSQQFQFDEEALNDPVVLVAETARLRAELEEADGPVTVTLAGSLVGGW